MEQQVQWKDTTEELLKQLKNSPIDYQVLDSIIQVHFESTKKEDILRYLQEQLIQLFQINPSLFLDYMYNPVMFKMENLSLDPPRYKRLLEYLNNLKIKYGPKLKDLINAQREPFSITSVETSIAHNESTHAIRFIRGDGKSLEGMFKPVSLMMIVASLTEALKISMERGIYNIDQNLLDMYMTQSNELQKLLKEVIDGQKND